MIVKGCVIFERTLLSRKKSHNLAWSCAISNIFYCAVKTVSQQNKLTVKYSTICFRWRFPFIHEAQQKATKRSNTFFHEQWATCIFFIFCIPFWQMELYFWFLPQTVLSSTYKLYRVHVYDDIFCESKLDWDQCYKKLHL